MHCTAGWLRHTVEPTVAHSQDVYRVSMSFNMLGHWHDSVP